LSTYIASKAYSNNKSVSQNKDGELDDLELQLLVRRDGEKVHRNRLYRTFGPRYHQWHDKAQTVITSSGDVGCLGPMQIAATVG